MSLTYHTTDIRNVALAGHGASGKTSLADALLFAAGATTRKGSVDDGTSALDVDDAENVDYRADLEAIRESFGTECVPFNVPIGQGPSFSGVVDVIQSHDEDPPGCPLPPSEAYQMVVEQIVETDEELMTRYLDGEAI